MSTVGLYEVTSTATYHCLLTHGPASPDFAASPLPIALSTLAITTVVLPKASAVTIPWRPCSTGPSSRLTSNVDMDFPDPARVRTLNPTSWPAVRGQEGLLPPWKGGDWAAFALAGLRWLSLSVLLPHPWGALQLLISFLLLPIPSLSLFFTHAAAKSISNPIAFRTHRMPSTDSF